MHTILNFMKTVETNTGYIIFFYMQLKKDQSLRCTIIIIIIIIAFLRLLCYFNKWNNMEIYEFA